MKKDNFLEDQLFYLLEKAHKVIRRYADEVLINRGFDVTIDQWLTLKKIYDQEQTSQNEIASALFKDKASIARILEILIRKRLVQKINAADKRIHLITLSDHGKDLVKKILGPVAGVRKKAIEGLSDNELKSLRHSLEKISRNLE